MTSIWGDQKVTLKKLVCLTSPTPFNPTHPSLPIRHPPGASCAPCPANVLWLRPASARFWRFGGTIPSATRGFGVGFSGVPTFTHSHGRFFLREKMLGYKHTDYFLVVNLLEKNWFSKRWESNLGLGSSDMVNFCWKAWLLVESLAEETKSSNFRGGNFCSWIQDQYLILER